MTTENKVAAVPAGAEEEAMLKALAEKEGAPVALPRTTETIKDAASAAVGRYWAGLKSKTRAASEYATLRTRQGVALFGEPNIGPIKTIVDRC